MTAFDEGEVSSKGVERKGGPLLEGDAVRQRKCHVDRCDRLLCEATTHRLCRVIRILERRDCGDPVACGKSGIRRGGNDDARDLTSGRIRLGGCFVAKTGRPE